MKGPPCFRFLLGLKAVESTSKPSVLPGNVVGWHAACSVTLDGWLLAGSRISALRHERPASWGVDYDLCSTVRYFI